MNLSCIPSELVEVVSLCILYSHIYSGLLISFVDVGRLTEPRKIFVSFGIFLVVFLLVVFRGLLC